MSILSEPLIYGAIAGLSVCALVVGIIAYKSIMAKQEKVDLARRLRDL